MVGPHGDRKSHDGGDGERPPQRKKRTTLGAKQWDSPDRLALMSGYLKSGDGSEGLLEKGNRASDQEERGHKPAEPESILGEPTRPGKEPKSVRFAETPLTASENDLPPKKRRRRRQTGAVEKNTPEQQKKDRAKRVEAREDKRKLEELGEMFNKRIKEYKKEGSTIPQGQKQEYWKEVLRKEYHILKRNDGFIPISDEEKIKRNREWIESSLPKLQKAIPRDYRSECIELSYTYIHEMMEIEKHQLLSSINNSYRTKIGGTLKIWRGQINDWLESLPTGYRDREYGGKEFESGKEPLTKDQITAIVTSKLLKSATSSRYNYGGDTETIDWSSD